MPELQPIGERIAATRRSMTIDSESTSEERDVLGVPWRRIEVGFSGSTDGVVAFEGPIPELAEDRYSWMYDAPDLTMPQEHFLTVDRLAPYPLPVKPGDGNTHPRHYARARFTSEAGAGMSVFLPEKKERWNGKLCLIQHGSGNYTALGQLKPRSRADLFTPGTGAHLFAEVMVDRGYAVAYLRKDASRPPLGVTTATLEDGSTIRTTFVGHVALPFAMVLLAQDYVEKQMGARPRRTYFYGHSGGGIAAHVMNFASGANRAQDGSRIIDGFLADDAGNGIYMPIEFRDGQDVCLTSEADSDLFAPQIDLTRQLYNPLSYLAAKRETARLLREKGLGNKHRYYEIRGISHFDAGQMDRAGDPGALDLGAFIGAMLDMLDRWVDLCIEPPASRADMPDFERPGVDLPEVTCPLGIYYAAPAGFQGNMAASRTGLAPFDGTSAPPVSADTGATVDIGGSKAQSMEAAWRRLGLLAQDEKFTEATYAQRLTAAAADAVAQGWLPGEMAAWYAREAGRLLASSGAR
ncbi:MAG: hypothetical protein JOZ39_03880 [Chloroflexi bacterium]|nr:hypothetical protein [Chloroflexota bacterium]